MVIHNNRDVSNSFQGNSLMEQFLFSVYKTKGEKDLKRFSHSLDKNVKEFSDCVCGTYVPFSDIMNADLSFKSNVPIRFPVVIPYRDLLVFQSFTDFPNSILGPLKLRFVCEPNAFVFQQVSPRITIKKDLLTGELPQSGDGALTNLSIYISTEDATLNFSRMFSSVTVPSPIHIISGFDTATNKITGIAVPDFNVVVRKLMINQATTNIAGFKFTRECRDHLLDFFRTQPFVECAQRIEYKGFTVGADDKGFPGGCTTMMPLNKTTDFMLLFPKYSGNGITCFENPMYHLLQLQV
jgi:hypothetical protein